MAELDRFLPHLNCQDTKRRVQLGADVLAYLEVPENSIESEQLGAFIDGITAWISSSNFKVAQYGLEIMGHLTDRMKDDFKPYISSVVPPAIDRLGDAKDSVREQARFFILKLNVIATPQLVFEKLGPAFNHKNWKVREEVLLCLQETLARHGSPSLSIAKMMPSIVKLLGDPNSQVREMAVSTIVEIYKNVGERVKHDLAKKYNVPTAKLQVLLARFDEVKTNGELLPSAGLDGAHRSLEDETDSKSQGAIKALAKRATSAPPSRRALVSKPPSASSGIAGSAGGADEELFIRSFEDVPRIQLYSSKEVDQELSRIKSVLGDSATHWEKRIDSLKKFRSLLLAGGAEYEDFHTQLKSMHLSFQLSVKDLRSQVVREACITIAYLSQQLGHRLDHFSEALLPSLINLIPNSAKIMSTAGIVAIRFIIQHTHASRLIPIITSNLQSKSKDIRRTCCEFLDQLVHTWPTSALDRHVGALQDALRRGISDADPEARSFSRKAFWGFADHFREQADALLASLDSSKQRMLHMSNSSSSNSLHSASGSASRGLRAMQATAGSVENLRGLGYATPACKRSGIPIFSTSKQEGAFSLPTSTLRSNSAIDLAAARRAKSRALYNLPPPSSRGLFSRPPSRTAASKPPSTAGALSAITSPERMGRSRVKGVSQSQPSSRSGSPSSRLSYANYHANSPATEGSPGSSRGRRKSGIPTPTSRDASPSRHSNHGGYERRLSLGSRSRSLLGAGERYPPPTTITTSEPLMAERILQQSQEAEVAMADALRGPAKRRYTAYDDQSDESETSSVCSDRSYGSYSRTLDDVSESLQLLSSIHWADKKEGLLGLQSWVRSGRGLSKVELRRAMEGLCRMLGDPHCKVASLALDTIQELLVRPASEDMGPWLQSLLSRLLTRLGATDLLASLQARILRALESIRSVFPCEEQLCVLLRFLADPTHTPNLRTKLAALHFLLQLLPLLDPSELSAQRPEVRPGLAKLVLWAADPKSAELRRLAQDAVAALFNANSPEFSVILSQLPKPTQDAAIRLLSSKRAPSPAPNSPRLTGRGSHLGWSQEKDDLETPTSEEVMNSLKKTADEIQRYRSDMDADSVDCRNSHDHREVRNGYHPPLEEEATNGGGCSNGGEEGLTAAVEELKAPEATAEQRKKALSHLVTLSKQGLPDLWDQYFRHVLCLVIETTSSSSEGSVRTMALRTLCELIKHQPHHFQDYVELTILKVLEASKDEDKDVLRAAEMCAGVAAHMLPPEQTARTLKPIIMTGDYPVNLAAIKMFTKLVEQQGDPVVQQLLPDIIPAVIKAYDSLYSSVRKAAVFCMVALHGVVGDGLFSHLKALNGSKLKLLNLYIQRAQGQSSGSTPGSPATTSSGH